MNDEYGMLAWFCPNADGKKCKNRTMRWEDGIMHLDGDMYTLLFGNGVAGERAWEVRNIHTLEKRVSE